MSKTFQSVRAQEAAIVEASIELVRAYVTTHGADWVAARVIVHERTVARWNDGTNKPTVFMARRIVSTLKGAK